MIIVFGSIYMDLNVKIREFPEIGDSVLTQSYTSTPGGKGANQALAAARAGAKTALVGKVGDDGSGLRILNNLKRHEVMTSGVAKTEEFPTGMAMVMKEKTGKPRTIVALGANALVDADQAPTDIFRPDNVLLVQMELPMEQNALVMKNAKDKGSQVILNLAPSLSIPKQLFSLVDFLIVNQIEARRLAERMGINIKTDIAKMARKLAKDG
ncbi:MAG TPA: PfkB family carbohydrate kinase, partial [Alphaproteobacteria bacterium]|nr:PfkB family carbohydrate kinase [Alphaproteobacteria bacterium]